MHLGGEFAARRLRIVTLSAHCIRARKKGLGWARYFVIAVTRHTTGNTHRLEHRLMRAGSVQVLEQRMTCAAYSRDRVHLGGVAPWLP